MSELPNDDFSVPTFPLESILVSRPSGGTIPTRQGLDLFAGGSKPVYFGAKDVIEITLTLPPAPCHRGCGRDLRGQAVALVEPHETEGGERAWFVACAPGEGCGT